MLLIDIGNTRLEWRMRHEKRETQGQQLCSEPLPDWPQTLQKVVVACVSGAEEIADTLRAVFAERLIWLDAPQKEYSGFIHCYPQPERLGVDRWLAMLGARRYHQGSVMVADAGTALTIDLLDAENRHLGGYIVPGLSMSQQVLFQKTDKVKPFQDEMKVNAQTLGKNTVQCVAAGTERQQLALLQSMQREYPQYPLLMTGGDGQRLAKSLAVQYYENLVLDGLEVLCAGYL